MFPSRMEVPPVAQKVTVRLVDDLDGSEASGTVEFALDGRGYAIDLSDNNAAKLREAFAPFVGAARKPGGRKRPATPNARNHIDRETGTAVRNWARDNGWAVADRGRIPASVLEAYELRDTSSPRN